MPYLLLTLSALCWSGNFVLGRAMNADIPPVGLLFWRWVVALVILIPLALPRLRRNWPLIRANLKLFPLFGLLGVTLFNLLLYTALQTTTAINAALINSAIPILIIIFAWLFHGQGVSSRQWLGITLSLSGVAAIILRGDPTALGRLSFTTGDLLVLGAAVAWALYSVALRRYPAGLDPFVFLFVIALCGMTFIAPLYLLEIASGRQIHPTTAVFATIGYVGLFASVVAFASWNAGIRQVGSQAGGQFIHLMPAFSTVLAVIFLGEELYRYHLAGIGLIVAGIFFATLRAPSPR